MQDTPGHKVLTENHLPGGLLTHCGSETSYQDYKENRMQAKVHKPRIIGLLLALAAATSVMSHPASVLSLSEVRALMDGKEAVYIYDANDRESYLKGHIPGARWVQYNAVTAEELPLAKNAKLIFYCYNLQCGASEQAAAHAMALGFRNVWRMPEGIQGWRAAKMPIVAGASAQ
jgi:rhodanese-related sulfurtransferase